MNSIMTKSSELRQSFDIEAPIVIHMINPIGAAVPAGPAGGVGGIAAPAIAMAAAPPPALPLSSRLSRKVLLTALCVTAVAGIGGFLLYRYS